MSNLQLFIFAGCLLAGLAVLIALWSHQKDQQAKADAEEEATYLVPPLTEGSESRRAGCDCLVCREDHREYERAKKVFLEERAARRAEKERRSANSLGLKFRRVPPEPSADKASLDLLSDPALHNVPPAAPEIDSAPTHRGGSDLT